ncbi:hypothetical protein Anapl_07254, partial [Anas platyrhynchos]
GHFWLVACQLCPWCYSKAQDETASSPKAMGKFSLFTFSFCYVE